MFAAAAPSSLSRALQLISGVGRTRYVLEVPPMDVFIYASPGFGHARDVIEDALEDALGDGAEVTGGGSGQMGSNIDLELAAGFDSAAVLATVRTVLKGFKCPADTVIEVDGTRYRLAG